jgi:hypothetical protein
MELIGESEDRSVSREKHVTLLEKVRVEVVKIAPVGDLLTARAALLEAWTSEARPPYPSGCFR